MSHLYNSPYQFSSPQQSENHHSGGQAQRTQNEELGNFSGTIERCLRNFILGKKFGVGTFSKVCLAKHKLTNQQVAIKIIEKAKIQNQADQIRLDREVKIMRKVRHPNIVQLYQIIQTNKYIYLVMEYAPRGQLFDHIVSREKLTQFQASKFLLQLTDAIEYLHQLGICHRDLKPQNLLLDYKYNIKVTDFGLSNIYPMGKLLKSACGSPSYACPQMLAGHPYNGLKADIWSLGIVLYAMCFGYLPFDNPVISELYSMIKKGDFQIPQFASQHLTDLLKMMLQVDPNKRATVEEIRSHPFCKFSIPSKSSLDHIPGIVIGLSDIPYEAQIQKEMREELRINVDNLREEIKKNKHNQNTCTYYLLLQRWLRQKNQTLSHYYSAKYNTINRYALIEKVKANFDKMQRNKMQVRKFQAVQEELRKKQKEDSAKNKQDSNTFKKSYMEQGKKVVHTQSISKKLNFIENQKQRMSQKQVKHYAPNNTKKSNANMNQNIFEQKDRKKSIKSKSKSKGSSSPHKSNSKNRSKSRSKSKEKVRNTKGHTQQKKKQVRKEKSKKKQRIFLQIPDQFAETGTGWYRRSHSNSKKKQSQASSPKKRNRIKTLEKQKKQKKNMAKNTGPKGTRLKF